MNPTETNIEEREKAPAVLAASSTNGLDATEESGESDKIDNNEADDNDADDDVGLSSATLLALQEFALGAGVAVDSYGSVIDSVRKHFEPACRDDVFDIHYTSKDGTREVNFKLKGVKKELGQTLDSTGLTIWRAAEHLCQFVTNHPEYFIGKTVCELGAGLGLVAVLLDKLGYCYNQPSNAGTTSLATSVSSTSLYTSPVMITDGDEDTMKLLIENKIDNDCSFDTAYLYWGEHEDFVLSNPHKFDLAIAADVIYEESQVEPLMETVAAIIKEGCGQFMLAFARRNVKIDLVYAAAAARGLEWRTIDDEENGVSGVEPIYMFSWRNNSNSSSKES